MKKIIFLFLVLSCGKLAAYHHGFITNISGGMTNTMGDMGQTTDSGNLSFSLGYLGAYQKENQKNYSYFKAGLDYEIGFVTDNSVHGLSLFFDSGAIIYDMWRIGAGLAMKNTGNGKDFAFILTPYLETGLMIQPFKKAGFDINFKLGAPVKLAGKLTAPYYGINKMDMLDWGVGFGYFQFF